MGRRPKFEERSAVISKRVPNSRKDEFDKAFDNVIDKKCNEPLEDSRQSRITDSKIFEPKEVREMVSKEKSSTILVACPYCKNFVSSDLLFCSYCKKEMKKGITE